MEEERFSHAPPLAYLQLHQQQHDATNSLGEAEKTHILVKERASFLFNNLQDQVKDAQKCR